MNSVFYDIIYKYISVYLNDILVCSGIATLYEEHLRSVL